MMHSVQGFRLDRIPDNLLREPLEFLVADHVRQRKLCSALEVITLGGEEDRAEEITDAIFAYLSEDFPLHISDEEADLFPSLRTSSHHDDDVDDLIDALTRDHAMELSLAQRVMVILQREMPRFEEPANTRNFAHLSATFTECVRRHLAIEDRMLLPLARKRLSVADFDRMGRAMAARRNIDYPG